MIRCRLLGPVEVTADGGPAPQELLWRKNLALLVYLVALTPRAAPATTSWDCCGRRNRKPRRAIRSTKRSECCARAVGEDAVQSDARQVHIVAPIRWSWTPDGSRRWSAAW